MKVFYIASARIEDVVLGRRIYQVILELGHKHTSRFMVDYNPQTFYEADESEWQKRYESRLSEIARAEVSLFEVSMHSLAIGQLVQESLRREKPVIVLYRQGKKPQFMTGTAEAENRLQLLEYDETDLKSVIEYGLETAKEMLITRFTMLLPPDLSKYLDAVNKNRGISRSNFIRNLIKTEMEKDESIF